MKVVIPMDLVNDQNPNSQSEGHERNTSMVEIRGIGSLPLDLIIEILSRLPVKVLCKFRCVSKQWFDLLSNDRLFVSKHREQTKRNPLLLFRKYSSAEKNEGDDYKVNIELTSIDVEGACINKVIASIAGPVYAFTSCGTLVILCCAFRVYVCNPSTHEFIRVPRSSSVLRYGTVGFGHLPVSNEYKIVHLFSGDPLFGDHGDMGCEIFTLRDGEDANSGSWRRIGNCPYRVRTSCSMVCLNGFVYWKVSGEANDLNNETSILSFDLEREEFRVISYPKFCSDSDQNLLFLTMYKGSLCLVDLSSGASTMDIWLLKEQSSSIWVKDYSIKLSALDAKIKIKSVVPSDDGDLLINREQEGLVYYNVENKTIRPIKNSATIEWYKKPCLYYDGFFSLHNK